MYKVVTKILAQRLKIHLNKLVDRAQSAFISGRLIIDNIVAAKEILHSMANSKSVIGTFALKIDISKAYGKVSWRFLSHCLRTFGIVGKTHELIMTCISTASFSVIINGQAERNFNTERGLRQGCPLSPYLFILCSQGLSWMMRTMESNALYNGNKICKYAPAVSHLMFAYDFLLFGTLDNQTVKTPMDVLNIYAAWSGQSTNMSKSAVIFSKGVDDDRKIEVATFMGVQQMENNDKYLGHYLLKLAYQNASFEFLIDKFDGSLAGWKSIFLSHARRMVLIKTVLGLIPPYFMATSIIPKKILQILTRTMRNFWWVTSGRKERCTS